MLIKREDLENIKVGRISLAFRRWRRPTVRAGGKLRGTCHRYCNRDGTYQNRCATREFFLARQLIAELRKHPAGTFYRIRLRFVGLDSRVALRRRVKVPRDELDQIEKALHGLGLE